MKIRTPESRTGCSWCNDAGELGPSDDRYLCPCPAGWLLELKRSADTKARLARAAALEEAAKKADASAQALMHAIGNTALDGAPPFGLENMKLVAETIASSIRALKGK